MKCLLCNSTEVELYTCYGYLCRECWERIFPQWTVVLACGECDTSHCPYIGRELPRRTARVIDEPLDGDDEDELGW